MFFLLKAVVCPINALITVSWFWQSMVGTGSHFAEKSNKMKKSLFLLNVLGRVSVTSIDDISYSCGFLLSVKSLKAKQLL